MVADLQLVIIGEAPSGTVSNASSRTVRLARYVRLLGTVNDADLLGWYRRAWTIASAVSGRGLGDPDRAAACGTPRPSPPASSSIVTPSPLT
ncbi:MAG: hypothetical protein R2715_08485 [Ilumatobacteraceae bacterium]